MQRRGQSAPILSNFSGTYSGSTKGPANRCTGQSTRHAAGHSADGYPSMGTVHAVSAPIHGQDALESREISAGIPFDDNQVGALSLRNDSAIVQTQQASRTASGTAQHIGGGHARIAEKPKLVDRTAHDGKSVGPIASVRE